MKYTKIKYCRLCKSKKITKLIDFGQIACSSTFPLKNNKYNQITPMVFCICENCKLAQLLHNYSLKELYNDNYGYRSGVNQAMIKHLTTITNDIKNLIKFKKDDYVLDIASNDGTLLKTYKSKILKYVGIDPTISRFKTFYPKNFKTDSTFFSKKKYLNISKGKKAKVITSIAVFYDVSDPDKFISEIKDILDKEGVYVMEQSYLPMLIKNNAYDSICHEHLTYFTLKQIKYLCEKNNLKVIKASTNSMNGGSIRVFITHKKSDFKINTNSINKCDVLENKYVNIKRLVQFKNDIKKLSINLNKTIKKIKDNKKVIHAYGASTKGNITLQYSKINKYQISFAADRNPTKWNRKMPGTNIPIISEKSSRLLNPDFYLVLPWHFRKDFIKRENFFLSNGGKLIFPLPKVEIVSKKKLK
tara:strand:- start:124 stop:1371 length:1248 start_codon:yes stop_codon:yes gene_type:complete